MAKPRRTRVTAYEPARVVVTLDGREIRGFGPDDRLEARLHEARRDIDAELADALRLEPTTGRVELALQPDGAALVEALLAESERCAWCRSYPYHQGRCQRCGHPRGQRATSATLRPCAAEPVGEQAVAEALLDGLREAVRALCLQPGEPAAREVRPAASPACVAEILDLGVPRAPEERLDHESHCPRAAGRSAFALGSMPARAWPRV